MVKIRTIAIALLFPLFATAQIAVSLDKMNVLYNSGVDNPLTVAVSDVPDSNLLLIPSVGEITWCTPWHKLNWRICENDRDSASLIVRDSLQQTNLDTFFYRVKSLPEPVPVRPSGHSGRRGIPLVLENFDFEARAEVISYEVIIVWKQQDPTFYTNRGVAYNPAVDEAIKRLVPGDTVIFYNFAYRFGCDTMIRHMLEELVFKVK